MLLRGGVLEREHVPFIQPEAITGITNELPCQPTRWVARARLGDLTCGRNELNRLRAVKQGADGVPAADICRKAGISQATYFNWRKKYDGLQPPEMRRLKALEDENAKPTDNMFIEAFNGRFRAECLSVHWFQTLDDARSKMEDWRRYYNEERPRRHREQAPDHVAKPRWGHQPATVKRPERSNLRRSKEWAVQSTRDSTHRWMKEGAQVKKVC